MPTEMLRNRFNIIASAVAALAVFAVVGMLIFMAFASFVWSLGASVPLSYVAGAAMGILTGGLIATPLVQRVLRLLRLSGPR